MDLKRLLLEAEPRWQALARDRPDLAPAVDLQRRLVTRSLELGLAIDDQAPFRLELAPSEAISRLHQKRPVLAGVPVQLDTTGLESFVLAFCDDLAQGGAGAPAERLRGTLERHEIDMGSLLAASLGRQQRAIRTKANHVGVAQDLLWLVAELGVAPIAYRLQRAVLTEAADRNQGLAAALATWDEGCCPACGSWPALAEVISGNRHLRCSFCGAGWQPVTYRCIYCGEAGESFLTAAADMKQVWRRLELCRTCGGYLKSVAVEDPAPFELLPVEDLSSSDLDVGAVSRGYTRPPMREFSAV